MTKQSERNKRHKKRRLYSKFSNKYYSNPQKFNKTFIGAAISPSHLISSLPANAPPSAIYLTVYQSLISLRQRMQS